jgi:amino acid adenylation domain-containing protein
MHHIISDGWSTGVLVREMGALYTAFDAGHRAALPELEIQYADFAHWQREWMQGEILETQLAYWRRQLDGAPAVLELPTDRPRPSVQTYSGAQEYFQLPDALSDSLEKLSRAQGVTLFMTLLAAFQTLLARYSGQTDISVGTPITGRNHTEIENLIGFFLNTLVLRTDLSGDPTFSDLLKQVREVGLGAYAHQDVPFEKLVEELQPERSMSHSPLFQVMFVLWTDMQEETLELPGLKFSAHGMDSMSAKFDLVLNLTKSRHGIGGVLRYNTDLFDASTISRLLGHFQTLLSAVTAHPAQLLSHLPLLSEAERSHLLLDFNPSPSPDLLSPSSSLQLLFEQQAARSPQAIALVCGSHQLSFSELNRRANQLSHLLIDRGINPESLVAIACDRSLEMAISVLAVIKAGAAYLPLDLSFPQQRIQLIIDDARPALVLTKEHLLDSLPHSLPEIVSLDAEWSTLCTQPEENPLCRAVGENLLYVIYTSGSTGTPKGVSIPYRVMQNLLGWHTQEMLVGVPMLQFASLGFDASIHELLVGWCTGGSVHIVSEEMRRDTAELARYIAAEGIEKMILPVVVFQQLMEEWQRRGSAQGRVREVTTTGEQLQLTTAAIDVMQRWQSDAGAAAAGCALYNHYGPSETHVVTSYRMRGAATSWPRRPPIGVPVANTRLYILDERLEVVPEGVRGEIYLGGAGVGRGYINRGGQTAERFMPDPYSTEAGARMYRTGDVGRYVGSGEVEYIRRVDEQVKVRGHRVEIGEVEVVLGGIEGVKECVVVLRKGEGGERLVGYVVGEESLEVGAVREEMRKRLPEYMVPSVVMRLKEMPLTVNGKVDKRALPAPDQSRPNLEVEFVAPRSAAEEVVAGIWAQVLGVERVGVKDNFFELGGHSLLTTQVVSRLNDVFRVEVPLRSLFQTPTIEGLVAVLAELWGGRELLEEVAQTFREIEKLSDDELKVMLREHE